MERTYVLLAPAQLGSELSALTTSFSGLELYPGAWIFPSALDIRQFSARVSELTSRRNGYSIVEISDLITV